MACPCRKYLKKLDSKREEYCVKILKKAVGAVEPSDVGFLREEKGGLLPELLTDKSKEIVKQMEKAPEA